MLKFLILLLLAILFFSWSIRAGKSVLALAPSVFNLQSGNSSPPAAKTIW